MTLQTTLMKPSTTIAHEGIKLTSSAYKLGDGSV
jgi:hypothetical protein